jgi:4-hydroxybenzoyl-CoA reductase subunit beta
VHLPDFEYVRPDSVAGCLQLLAEAGSRAAILAGGTDLIPTLRQRLASPELLIGIRHLPELSGVDVRSDGSIDIGAACTLTTLAEHPVVRPRMPALAAAVRSVGSRHVRNLATLGGNLALPTRCWYTNQSEAWRAARPPCFKINGDVCYVIRSARECFALQSSDSAPALIALNARVTLANRGGTRELPLAEFFRKDGLSPVTLEPGDLLQTVRVPPAEDRATFIKVAQRTGLDYGLGTIGAAITGNNRRVVSARLVVGSIGSWPMRLHQAEHVIEERGLTDDAIEAAADLARQDLGEVTNLYSPSGYKRRLVRGLVRRALREIRRQKPGETAAAT